MPTITVKRDLMFHKIGRSFSEEEFDKLCFEFGIELDEVVEGEPPSNIIEYKIDIPANRYDLLCVEMLSSALKVFMKQMKPPLYKKIKPKAPILMKVDSSVDQIRPFVVTSIIRNVRIDPDTYNSLLDLQEKLHHNICRKRALVAIGVHDLDTLTPPFFYSAQKPQNIKFIPLNQVKEFRADELMVFYESDPHLKPYLGIIRDFPLYPIIKDSKGVILSMPPIINGDHSKVKPGKTNNIYIEATATDLTKAKIVVDTLTAMIAEQSTAPYQFEATIVEKAGNIFEYPPMEYRKGNISVKNANEMIGIDITASQMAENLTRMSLRSEVTNSGKSLSVEIPPTRHDVIHESDIVEDVAISYGYDNIQPSTEFASTIARQYPVNKLTDALRNAIAQAGYTEALTFSLCSVDDETTKVRWPDNEKNLVRIENPKTAEFQAARRTLLPGLLKTISANKKMPIPLKIFEISDVVVLDSSTDVGTRNERHFCAVYYSKTPGFELIHGLLDRTLQLLEVKSYKLNENLSNQTYFSGRCADILVGNESIGSIGVLHPEVVSNFDLTLPLSAFEISIESFV